MQRSEFVYGTLTSLALTTFRPHASAAPTNERIADLERFSGGRLGVAALVDGKPVLTYNADRRFLTCSTFKLLAGAAVLQRVDSGRDRFDRPIPYNHSALLKYAPIARKNVGRGYMTIDELCGAALEYSDNTAANLLLGTIGGPHAVTSFARSIGDLKTNLEHYEPRLNDSPPDGSADTTTPLAMAMDAHAIVLGDVLKPQSRERLTAWLKACKTGVTLIRAGVPSSWQAGDKSGMLRSRRWDGLWRSGCGEGRHLTMTL